MNNKTLLSLLPAPVNNRSRWPWTEETNSDIYLSLKRLPKITIITPSYNQGNFIEETIRSVLLQNYPHLEFIIIDGGSTDNTVELIKKYEPWISYWVSEKDKGTYEANNKAMKIMTGDYWCILNSDDIFLKDCLYNLVKALDNEGADWITGGMHAIDESSQLRLKVTPKVPEQKIANLTFTNYCWIYHPCTFLSRRVYEDLGEFKPIDIMDYEYWIRMELKGYFPVIIPEYLSGLRYHTNCKSHDAVKMYRLFIDLLNDLKGHYKSKNIYTMELDKKISEWATIACQTKVRESVDGKKYFSALKILLQEVMYRPNILGKKWFFGLVNRAFIKGFKGNEFKPLNFLEG